MKAELYWIEAPGPGRIGIMPRPRGGDWLADELRDLKSQGVTTLVSLLEEIEVGELDLASEPAAAGEADLEYLCFPIPDHSVPTHAGEARAFMKTLARRKKEGSAIAIHCRAGIGRSALVAAGVLLLEGVPLSEVFERLEKARGFSVPETREQWDWLAEFDRGRR